MKKKNVISSSISATWLHSVSTVVIASALIGVSANPAVARPPTNVQVNSSFDGPFSSNKQNEPSLAQSPKDPRILVVGANDFRGMPACQDATLTTPSSCPIAPVSAAGATGSYASFDGGVTWICETRIDLSQYGFDEYSYGDPALTFDSAGNLYYATLGFPNGALPGAAPSDLFVAKSSNGGCTYTSVKKASGSSQGVFDDKPAIAADANPDSPFSNNIYTAWVKLPNASNGDQILFARSMDGGTSWSKPVQLTSSGAPGIKSRTGAAVQVGPDGTVYVIWFDYKGTPSIHMQISRDGGNTFLSQGQNITVATVTDDRKLLSGTSFRSGRVFPSFTIAGNGTLHVVWSNHTNNHASVMATRSTDGGQTWSTPIVAGDLANRSAFFASASADPTDNNKVNVVFQALDDVPAGTNPGRGVVHYDTYFAQSADGGTTFGSPVRISTASSDPDGSSLNGLGAQFLGDYMTAVTDLRGGRIFAVWTDARNATPCAAVDAYRLAPPGTPKPNVIADCPIKFGNTDIFFGAKDY